MQIEAQASPPPDAATPRRRILGIDMARGIAIIGMVMVHIGPYEVPGDGVLAATYRSPHGRASILFVVLAGMGVSLLTGDRSPTRLATATRQLWWRALVLLPIGLFLQHLPTRVAVILQYYAVYFVVAAVLARARDRTLLVVAGASATLGPIGLVWLQQVAPTWFQPGVPAWNDALRLTRDIIVTGYYPVVVWTAPLAMGMWIGRRDLRDDASAWRMLGSGALVAAAGLVISDTLVAVVGQPASETDWRQLVAIVPHNEMPLWLATSTGIAVAITGGCMLLGRRLPRVSWPLVAFGQLALTVYVLHVLVLAVWPQWLVRDDLAAAWRSVALFTIVSVTSTTLYRLLTARGPFEMLVRLPAFVRAPSGERLAARAAPRRRGTSHAAGSRRVPPLPVDKSASTWSSRSSSRSSPSPQSSRWSSPTGRETHGPTVHEPEPMGPTMTRAPSKARPGRPIAPGDPGLEGMNPGASGDPSAGPVADDDRAQ